MSMHNMVLLYMFYVSYMLYALYIVSPAKLGPPAESITGPYSS